MCLLNFFLFFEFGVFQSALCFYFIILHSTRHDVLPPGRKGRDEDE